MTETRTNPSVGERWRHCKGTEYEIVGVAMHTEDEVELVLYQVPAFQRSLARIWARPLAMFMDRHTSGAWRFERVQRMPDAMPFLTRCGEIPLKPDPLHDMEAAAENDDDDMRNASLTR